MNVSSLFSSCLEVKSLFLSLYQKQQQNIPREKKREKGKGAAERQPSYSSLNIGFHGNRFGSLWRLNSPIHTRSNASNITFVWSTFFGLLSSPSSSCLLSSKIGITEIKKSFNKLAELGLHQSPLKPFYCSSEIWMKSSQHKAQLLTVRLSEGLPSPCLAFPAFLFWWFLSHICPLPLDFFFFWNSFHILSYALHKQHRFTNNCKKCLIAIQNTYILDGD